MNDPFGSMHTQPHSLLTPDQIAFCQAHHSLHHFLRQSWRFIEGSTLFIDNWHLQVISELLEAVCKRQIKRLLINIPPRSGKTSLISIALPAWAWIHNAEEKFLYASYAESLSLEHSLKCRRLIESPWYQERWGHLYQLAADQNAKGFFENTAGGYRIATSVGGSSTGKGGSILICDDPNNVKDGESEAKREETNKWFSTVWSTRLNNHKNDVHIVVQQRLHEQDVSGVILDHDEEGEWVKLILPNEFEESRRSKTIVLPSTNGKIWQDPRMTEGELLCTERFGEKETRGLKKILGSYAYAGQYQQRPSPAGGGIIKREWFKIWQEPEMPNVQYVFQSWDTAFSEEKSGSYSAMTCWGVFLDRHGNENVILLSAWRDHVEYHDLKKMVRRLCFDYRDIRKEHDPSFKGRHTDSVMIEAKASGQSLIQDLRRTSAGVSVTAFDPGQYGDKDMRLRRVADVVEGGLVWLPSLAPGSSRLQPFAEDLLEEVLSFPKGKYRDLTDTLSQALIKLKEKRFLVLMPDLWECEPSYEAPKVYCE